MLTADGMLYLIHHAVNYWNLHFHIKHFLPRVFMCWHTKTYSIFKMIQNPVTIRLVFFPLWSTRMECDIQEIINFAKLHKKSEFLSHRKWNRKKTECITFNSFSSISTLNKVCLFSVHGIYVTQGTLKHISLYRCRCTACIHNLFSCYSFLYYEWLYIK